jgi:hypothetical protein
LFLDLVKDRVENLKSFITIIILVSVFFPFITIFLFNYFYDITYVNVFGACVFPNTQTS